MDWIHCRDIATEKLGIMCLYGPAGSGKWAILQSIAEMWCEEESLPASYFFSRFDFNCDHPRSLTGGEILPGWFSTGSNPPCVTLKAVLKTRYLVCITWFIASWRQHFLNSFYRQLRWLDPAVDFAPSVIATITYQAALRFSTFRERVVAAFDGLTTIPSYLAVHPIPTRLHRFRLFSQSSITSWCSSCWWIIRMRIVKTFRVK